jgi:hypothetical protein
MLACAYETLAATSSIPYSSDGKLDLEPGCIGSSVEFNPFLRCTSVTFDNAVRTRGIPGSGTFKTRFLLHSSAVLQLLHLPGTAAELACSSLSPLFSSCGNHALSLAETGIILLVFALLYLACSKYYRMSPPKVSSPILTSSAAGKHIMISYKWGAHVGRVRRFARALKTRGYDVWIDVQGSKILDAMVNLPTTGDAMCKAVGLASHVIVCVEPGYLLSDNCNLELTWATQREKMRELKVIYVMLEEHCTPCDIPDHDGIRLHKIWMHIGGRIYHQFYNDAMIPGLVENISRLLAPLQNNTI